MLRTFAAHGRQRRLNGIARRPVDAHNLLPIGAILAAAAILVAVLWRLMRPHIPPKENERQEARAEASAGTPPSSADEAEYLDSSHIIVAPPHGRGDPPR